MLSQFRLGLVRSKAGRLRTLNERLELNAQRGINSVLVVDEAQAIESVKGFEELRLLTNFQLNNQFLLTVVLIGQPELRHRVAGIPQLNQRIAGRAHLGPFTTEETTSYISVCMRYRDRPDRHVYEEKRCQPYTNRARGSGALLMLSAINVSLAERSSTFYRSMIVLFGGSGNPYDE